MSYCFDESYYIRAATIRMGLASSARNTAGAEAEFLRVLAEAGLTPKEHYEHYGRFEGLNPNAYFNEREYLAARLRQLHSHGEKDGNGEAYALGSLAEAIAAAGLIPAEHYERFGAYETDDGGNYINPSNAFDVNAYLTARLLLAWNGTGNINGRTGTDITMDDLIASLVSSGMSPVSEYIRFGAEQTVAVGMALVQTVPVPQRVPNDARRQDTGEIVPANYNAASIAPRLVAIPFPPPKPADIGGYAPETVCPAAASPATPVPVPGDAAYAPPPPGWADTLANPLVPASVSGPVKSARWVSLDTHHQSGIVLESDGSVAGTLPPGSVWVDATDALLLTDSLATREAALFTASAGGDAVSFANAQADEFVTNFGSAGVRETQGADFADVTLESGQTLIIQSDGKSVTVVNITGGSLSGDALASFVADAALDGWSAERNGSVVTYTADIAGDRESITITHVMSAVVSYSVDLAAVSLNKGDCLCADGSILYMQEGGTLGGEELAGAVAANGTLEGWLLSAEGTRVTFTPLTASAGTVLNITCGPGYEALSLLEAEDAALVPVAEIVKGQAPELSLSSLANLDTITDFNWLEDRIVLPTAITKLVKFEDELGGVTAEAFSALAGKAPGLVGAFQAGLAKYNDEYYLFVNDKDEAFDADRDIVIKLVGVSDADAQNMTADIFITRGEQ